MKKNLWFVFVALAMVAIFTVAGCKPTTPPTPTPTPTATPTPTVAPDTACPKVVSTVVSKAYDAEGDYNFKIVITFDEPVELGACAEDPGNWNVTVSNSQREDTAISANVAEVKVAGKKVTLYASVSETVSGQVYLIGVGNVRYSGEFDGLICSEEDAESYGKLDVVPPYGDLGAVSPPTVADSVSWELADNCLIYDELGNACCDYEGEDCCLEPVCPECPTEECPLGTGICP